MSVIIGGTPTGDGDALIDVSSAVLLDEIVTVKVGAIRKGEIDPTIGLELSGRINKSDERLSTLFLMDGEAAAKLVADLVGLASEISPEFLDRFIDQLDRLDRIRHRDAFGRTRP